MESHDYKKLAGRMFLRWGVITLGCCLILAMLCACQPPYGDSGLGRTGCRRCHQLTLDRYHDFRCNRCHAGHPEGYTMAQAHAGLVQSPADPKHSGLICGTCHAREEASARKSLHYSLKKEIGAVWKAFFPGDNPPVLRDIKASRQPDSARAIVMDALARRCLRCHVYCKGDAYSMTARGKGCAACHMDLRSRGHAIFKEPAEKNCLACHYANFVGWDYEGRFEKDYPEDFRAPLVKGHHIPRPYGVEWIAMQQDVHRKAGMSCLDCHGLQAFHPGRDRDGNSAFDTCRRCHALDQAFPGHRPADSARVTCGSCHAVWTALDMGRNLMRQDEPDLEDWGFLKAQGSSEVEHLVDAWAGSKDIPPAGTIVMTDKFTNIPYPGLWFAGFLQRRWSPVILGTDADGRLSVIRPLLDISISWVDARGEVIFDSLSPGGPGPGSGVKKIVYPPYLQLTPVPPPGRWLPVHPHTIGKADAFRTRFVQKYLSQW